MSDAIATRDLRYEPGPGFRLEGLDLRVPEGSIFGFLGANGSGKSTTIRILMGMTPRDSGDVSVLGHEVPSDLPSILDSVGYVPERPHLYRNLSVADSLRAHAGFFSGFDWTVANDLIRRFHLAPELRIKRMSKGEVGKLLVLQALAQRPDLLVLDEPTDGLDPVVRRDLYEAILDYVASSGATVFLSSHLVHELERVCDHIAVIDHGSLIHQGPIEAFKGGIRRLRVSKPVAAPADSPFRILKREPTGVGCEESWLVSGWADDMVSAFDAWDGGLAEVTAFDLETGFVELLRAARGTALDDSHTEVQRCSVPSSS